MAHPYTVNDNADKIRLLDPVVKKNGVDIGYLDGQVTLDCNINKWELNTGTPEFLVGQLNTEFINKIKAKFFELTPENIAFGLGMSETECLKVWDGTEEYDDYWVTDINDMQTLQFTDYAGGDFEAAETDHGNIVSVTDIPVLYPLPTEATPSPSAYVECTDYFVDYINGYFGRLSTGSIPSGAFVKAKYKCVPSARTEIALTRTNFKLWSGTAAVEGTDVSTGEQVIDYMPKAEVSGGGLVTNGEGGWAMDVEISAVDNPDTPDYPMGYIDIDFDLTAA